MGHQPGLFGVHSREGGQHGFAEAGSDADGDGVDEHPHHRPQSRHLGRATGHQGAEDEVVTAGQGLEDQRPRGLDHGVRGDAGGPDELGDRGPQVRAGTDRDPLREDARRGHPGRDQGRFA
ncbi:hypothetical protein GCM10029964_078150 [Kibdelosporangium lantanae]